MLMWVVPKGVPSGTCGRRSCETAAGCVPTAPCEGRSRRAQSRPSALHAHAHACMSMLSATASALCKEQALSSVISARASKHVQQALLARSNRTGRTPAQHGAPGERVGSAAVHVCRPRSRAFNMAGQKVPGVALRAQRPQHQRLWELCVPDAAGRWRAVHAGSYSSRASYKHSRAWCQASHISSAGLAQIPEHDMRAKRRIQQQCAPDAVHSDAVSGVHQSADSKVAQDERARAGVI